MVRYNILNIKHFKTRTLFYIHLSPAENNKDIYDIEIYYIIKLNLNDPDKKEMSHNISDIREIIVSIKTGMCKVYRRLLNSKIPKKRKNNQCKVCTMQRHTHSANYKGCTIYKKTNTVNGKYRIRHIRLSLMSKFQTKLTKICWQ